jgi:hypothetical protein
MCCRGATVIGGHPAGTAISPTGSAAEGTAGRSAGEQQGGNGGRGNLREAVRSEGEEEALVSAKLKVSQGPREEHEDGNHGVYRSWCAVCVAARGLGQGHHAADDGEDEQLKEPKLSLDYGYMSKREDDVLPILFAKEAKTKLPASAMVEAKGPTTHAVKFLIAVIKELGFKKMVLMSDNEPAIKALKDRVIAECKDVELIPRESPEGDHQANGDAENAVREGKRQVRAIKMALEQKLGEVLPTNHPLLTWIPWFAANLQKWTKLGKDGRTPEMRVTGRAWKKPMLQFGEKLHFKPVSTEPRMSTMEPKMLEGRFLGYNPRTGALVAPRTAWKGQFRSTARRRKNDGPLETWQGSKGCLGISKNKDLGCES